MFKQLRPYQAEALATLRKRMKETTHPLLVNASVGAGKSLIIAELLLVIERAGWRALCLTLNSTLIQQNKDTYQLQGGNPGVYCAGLNSKDFEHLVIFASPHSVCKNISNQGDISRQPFNLIIVDEAHNISPHDESTMFRRICNHYGFLAQQEQYSFRIVGLTGTPYRGKGISIVGPKEFFKEQVCDISASWLISQGYLTKPQFGYTNAKSIDFSDCKVNSLGQFRHADLEMALSKDERLTGEIMRELQTIKYNGIFIFASTKKHCEECTKSLPDGTWAIITGDTPHEERKKILDKARRGDCKYLINVNCLLVGVDVPYFDVCAFLRPTESLVLYTQAIGRVLRLHPGKERATILDYAGNLQRHGDIDDPIINEALKPNEDNQQDYCIPCYTCGTDNTVHARRCIGILASNKRCEHYFEFKECACGVQNDITSRLCRGCDCELIDPNAKLTRQKAITYTLNVIEAEYKVLPQGYTSWPIIHAAYNCQEGWAREHYYTNTEKAKNILYARFIRLHLEKYSDYYMHLTNIVKMKEMIAGPMLTPSQLICTVNEHGFYKIVKKIFT